MICFLESRRTSHLNSLILKCGYSWRLIQFVYFSNTNVFGLRELSRRTFQALADSKTGEVITLRNYFYASSTNTVIGKFLYVDFILVVEKVLQFAYTLRESFVNYLKAVALIKIKDAMWQEIKWK